MAARWDDRPVLDDLGVVLAHRAPRTRPAPERDINGAWTCAALLALTALAFLLAGLLGPQLQCHREPTASPCQPTHRQEATTP